MNYLNKRKDETQAMQDFFRNNLETILREKGCHNRPQMVAFLENLAEQNKASISSGAMMRWVYDGWLPKFKTLQQVAIWLNCETGDLLPTMYHNKLKGFENDGN